MTEELKQIKKIYGEETMHLCRDLFPDILECKWLLYSILTLTFAPTHSLAKDIKEKGLQDEFKKWIYSFTDKKSETITEKDKNPFELMDEAGYTLYECKTEKDIQKFKKYYAPGEKICTFNGGRLENCYVFFAVKKDVDEIKREDFIKPQREDRYGTSVISIQFSKKSNILSIKNRYNHAVFNPDATFSNNLENIIPGLSKSFEKYYGYKIDYSSQTSSFLTEDLHYVKSNEGKYYRYNVELGFAHYCENNIIIDEIGNLDEKYAYDNSGNSIKEKYILFDNFVADLKGKDFFTAFKYLSIDSFIHSIYSVGKISKITVNKLGNNKIIKINYINNEEVLIGLDEHNSIILYQNDYIDEIGPYFLEMNTNVRFISLKNVKKIKECFLLNNSALNEIYLDKVEKIGNKFLYHNNSLKDIDLPNIRYLGRSALFMNPYIKIEVDNKEKKLKKTFKNNR